MERAYVDWSADDGKTLVFEKVKLPEVLSATERLKYVDGRLCPEVVFDLEAIETAFSAQVLPLVVLAQDLRHRGVALQLVLPADQKLAALFINTNWAHLIAPERFEASQFDGHHLAATSYRTAADQQDVVNRTVELLLEEAHLDRGVLGALEWSLNETTDNVLTHSESGEGGIVQVTRYETRAHIVVCDSGRGIGASMRVGFPDLIDDLDAVRKAILPGVTSGPGQGNGLAGIVSIAQLSGGDVTFLSGHAFGQLAFGPGSEAERWDHVIGGVDFPGTAVVLDVPLDVPLDLRRALSFQSPEWEPFDFIDARYEVGDATHSFELRLADERRGLASRDAGRALRTKVENLLATAQDASVIVDFSGVRMVASSFADEFLGKLRAAMGPAAFDAQIRLVNISDDVQTVLAGAVSQRMRSSS